jgi:hypothetical protein
MRDKNLAGPSILIQTNRDEEFYPVFSRMNYGFMGYALARCRHSFFHGSFSVFIFFDATL